MVPEMRTLQAGYEVQNQLQEDAQNGVTQEDRANLKEFDQKVQRAESVQDDPDPSDGGRETVEISDMH